MARRRGPVVRALSSALLALAALVSLAGCASAPPRPAAGSFTVYPAGERRAAPELAGELVGGGELDPARLAGQIVVVNFWASWCGPCVVEADDLEQTYRSTKDLGVVFVGVNVRDERDKAQAFLVGRASYPSLFDPAGRLALSFAVPPASIPTTIIIDRSGRIAAVQLGAVFADRLEPLIRTLAAEPSPGPQARPAAGGGRG
jgi:thiol-disulfide isomerase/thioredoxin